MAEPSQTGEIVSEADARRTGMSEVAIWLKAIERAKKDEEDWRKEITFWKKAGVTHITAHTTFNSAIHQRIEGTTPEAHLAALARARGVAWFNDDAEHARLTAHIARLGDWLAQVRAAHAAIVHGASLQQAREVAG